MTLVTQIASCDGFTVEAADGCLGWVEETWLDVTGHPAALALRTADGGRALLPAEAVVAVDADAQEVFVAADATLRGLEPPLLERRAGEPTASWRATGTVEPATAAAHAGPDRPAVVAARMATHRVERPLWHTVLVAFGLLALLVAFEIGLAFGVAWLVTGRLT